MLLIACGNVANLLLARGAVRAREIALRTALGAGQWRIVRQLLTESLVLAMGAAVAGLFIARAFVTAVVAWSPSDVPRLEQARIDPVAFGFAIAIALASSVLCGLAPALRLSRRRDLQYGLRDGGRGSTGGHRDRLRAALIVAEVALAAAAGRRRPVDSQRHRAATNNDGFEPRRVERSYHIACHRLQRAGAGDRDAAAIHDAAVAIGCLGRRNHVVAAMGGGGGSNGLVPEGREPNMANIISSTLRVIPRTSSTMGGVVNGRNFTTAIVAMGSAS